MYTNDKKRRDRICVDLSVRDRKKLLLQDVRVRSSAISKKAGRAQRQEDKGDDGGKAGGRGRVQGQVHVTLSKALLVFRFVWCRGREVVGGVRGAVIAIA